MVAVLAVFALAGCQKSPKAEEGLGYKYSHGQGVLKNYRKAVYWYKKAAHQGDVHAEEVLGAMYFRGQGVPQNDQKAAYWFKKAANQGDVASEWTLGLMYFRGRGVPQNFIDAYMWSSLVKAMAAPGSQLYRLASADMYAERSDMAPAQIARAQALAAAWDNAHARLAAAAFSRYEKRIVTTKASAVAQNFNSAVAVATSAVSAALAGQVSLLAASTPGAAITPPAATPLLSNTAGDPALASTAGATNYAFYGVTGSTAKAPATCGEIDVTTPTYANTTTPGSYTYPGLAGDVIITVSTTCTNKALAQDIVNAVIGDGLTLHTAATSPTHVHVRACAVDSYCQTDVGPDGIITP